VVGASPEEVCRFAETSPADGVALADSDSPTGNVGFPSEPEAIDYFIDQMLKPTSQRLTAGQLDELRRALGDLH
jgi:hypothetical protein